MTIEEDNLWANISSDELNSFIGAGLFCLHVLANGN